MIEVTHNYTVAAKEKRPEIVWSVWTTPRGRYLWSNVFPSDAMITFFGSVNLWDGTDQTLGDGQLWGGTPVCEYGQRILNPGSITTSLVSQRGKLLVSLGQSERGAISIEYENTDHFFSRLLSDQRNEVFLRQRHDLYHGFLGIDPEDFIKLPTMEITQIRYTKARLIVVSEMQASVYRIDPEVYVEPLTTYALYLEREGE